MKKSYESGLKKLTAATALDAESQRRELEQALASVEAELHVQRGAGKKLLALQKRKQQLMKELAVQLSATRSKRSRTEDSFPDDAISTEHVFHLDQVDDKPYPVYEVTAEAGRLYVIQSNGTKALLQVGDVVVDSYWGLSYRLDDRVPAAIKRRVAVEKTKFNLMEISQRQVEEAASHHQADWIQKYTSYGGMKGLEQANDTASWGGFMAERFIMDLLKRDMLNRRLDFEIVPGDAFEDNLHKVDFYIIDKRPAVKGKQRLRLGFQLTTRFDFMAKKNQEIINGRQDLADDDVGIQRVIPIYLPLRKATYLYRLWQQNPTPGGPTGLLAPEEKQWLVHQVLEWFHHPQAKANMDQLPHAPRELDEDARRPEEKDAYTIETIYDVLHDQLPEASIRYDPMPSKRNPPPEQTMIRINHQGKTRLLRVKATAEWKPAVTIDKTDDAATTTATVHIPHFLGYVPALSADRYGRHRHVTPDQIMDEKTKKSLVDLCLQNM